MQQEILYSIIFFFSTYSILESIFSSFFTKYQLFIRISNECKEFFLRPLTNQELIDSYDYLSGAASSQDCTGLIPSAPLSEAELDSYEELYPFLPPVPPASDIKDNNEAPEDTSGITG